MKITGIEIGEYRQFKNIKFDFTYPASHEKAGQPLEKICFIGQSGTGKTTLLNLISWYFASINEAFVTVKNQSTKADVDDNFDFESFPYKVMVRVLTKEKIISLNGQENGDGWNLIEWFNNNELFNEVDNQQKLCVHINDSIAAESNKILRRNKSTQQSDYIKTTEQIKDQQKADNEQLESIENTKVLNIGTSSHSDVTWRYLLTDINKHDNNLNQIALSIIQQAGTFSADKLVRRITDWKLKNPNPRIELADKCLNPLLKELFLELDSDNTEVPIVLKTTRGISLQSHVLSTGTKQLLTTAIPIFQLRKSGMVILFDEPERSLFPDIQRKLIDYYTSLAPKAQFFFATHSPIIASAFEPCERFILNFDENGEVKYHTGVAPEGDDPNDILRQDFDMAYLMLEKGLKAYQRYLDLATEIRNEQNTERKKQLLTERAKLGDLYNF